MRKRILFYFFQTVSVLTIIYISFFLYWRELDRTTSFFIERIGNVILILFLIIILSNLFNLITYRRFISREFDFAQELIRIIGRVFVIILIVSFLEFFIFYETKIGRIIYVNLYFLVSIYYIVESIVINILIGAKKQRILWLSTIPYESVKEEYLTNSNNLEIDQMEDRPEDVNIYDFTIYDYPPREERSIGPLLHTIISVKNPVDLITYIEEMTERIPLKYVDDTWLLKNIRTYETVYDKVRRILNFISSLVLLIGLFVPAFLFALVHRCESKGPIFFIQPRAGYKGRIFNMIKFRTMIEEAEKEGPMFTDHNDSRVTKVGRVMRRFRVDEVPQLINVLKGDMNLIGPRPERDDFIHRLEKEIPYYGLRLQVRPGLTGWAQVNHPYAGNNIADHLSKLEYDFYYIKYRSLPLDILILLKTFKTMVERRGT
jgi:lipopolysaccharide/colanic/teichoic acid biosynthesis glycosyltransferase